MFEISYDIIYQSTTYSNASNCLFAKYTARRHSCFSEAREQSFVRSFADSRRRVHVFIVAEEGI